jgi:hypothetical protein
MYERSGISLSLRRFALPIALLGAFLASNSADAQRTAAGGRSQARLLDVTGMSVPEPEWRVNVSPNFDARSVPSSDEDRDWLILRAVYETAPDWTDDITVTFYALFKIDSAHDSQADPSKRYLLLQGEMSYINLDRGTHNAFMFIHPDTLERYGDVERIAVLLRHKGQDAGSMSDPKAQEGWWTQLKPVAGQLLSRDRTPFNNVNRGYYDMMKPGTSQRR